MDGYFLLLINAALYIITFVVYLLKKRMLDFGAICLFTFMLSSIGSAWYYSFDKVPSFYPDISIPALLYIYLLFLLFVIPFLYLKRNEILSVNLKKYAVVLNMLSSFFAIIAVPVFFNLVFNFLFKSFSGNALNSMYESDVDNATLIFLPGIKTCYSFMRRFYDLIAFLFCYNLLHKGNGKIKIGLGMSVLSFFMVTFQGGSRGGIIMNLISIGGLILLFYRLYDNTIKRYVRIMGVSVIGILVLGLMAISVSRFAANDTRDSDRVIDQWIAQYLGEGIVRFSDDLYPINNTLDGDKNFSYYKSLVGYPAIEDNEKANLKYEAKLKIPTSVFYTFIGSYYLDFGFVGTILFACCMSFFIFKLCNRINLTHQLGFVSSLIIIKYFKMISTGFTSNVYAVTSVQKDEFIFWLLIAGICLFSALRDRESSIMGGVIRAFKRELDQINLSYSVPSLKISTL